jgi:hypothetical protein
VYNVGVRSWRCCPRAPLGCGPVPTERGSVSVRSGRLRRPGPCDQGWFGRPGDHSLRYSITLDMIAQRVERLGSARGYGVLPRWISAMAMIIWVNWWESGGMNGSASGTVSSTSKNTSSEVPLAAGRCEEKIRVGWS